MNETLCSVALRAYILNLYQLLRNRARVQMSTSVLAKSPRKKGYGALPLRGAKSCMIKKAPDTFFLLSSYEEGPKLEFILPKGIPYFL
jgi:hypothetical protein